jgi:transcriptional regulator GlxA family with amidase domain
MPAESRHRVAVLVLPGVLPLDFGIAVQTFQPDPHYAMAVCADPAAQPIRSTGFGIAPDHGLRAVRTADTVIVPGYADPEQQIHDSTLRALQQAHTSGKRLVSICTGAFALAATGILDGRPATTHWRHADLLQRRHPEVKVNSDALFVDDGDILTSAGVTAGIDLCLHIIRNDRGAAEANARARMLVAPPRREGGQSQFIQQLRPDERAAGLASTRQWMLANLAQPLALDSMARHAHMSRRSFVRRFRQETATSPLAWLTSARLDYARELLETTTVAVDRIGSLTGLGSPAATRATFQRHLGTSPQSYRKLFTHNGTDRLARR